MKRIVLILLTISFFQHAGAQVSGNLVTADSLPVVAANISLLKNTDSSFVKAALSNEKGFYRIENIQPGAYLLRISSVGLRSIYSEKFTIMSSSTEVTLGTTVLNENKKELEGVVVRAQKPVYQQKPGGMVVNVENSMFTKGSSALQVLERSPGVVIDHRNNSIALNGKNGVMVMINGKLVRMPIEQLVNMLEGMNADDIATIELLTTPPAKYDAEGSAGLINIVLKKGRKQGTNGNISLTAGYAKAEKATASVNLSHNTKSLGLYGSYTYSRNKTFTDMFVESRQDMPFLGGKVVVDGWFNTNLVRNNHDATVGMDLKLDKKTTIGASVTYNNSNMSGTTVTDAGYTVLPDSLLQFNGINHGVNHWNNSISSVYVEKEMSKGGKINFSTDYLYFKNDAGGNVQSSFVDKHGMQAGDKQPLFSPAQKSFANTNIQVGVATLDYSKQVNKSIRLETGIKGAYTKSESSSAVLSYQNGAWVGADQTSNYIQMKEGIGAAYISLNTKLSEKINLVAGLRYEYSNTNMDNFKTGENVINRKLGVFFPNIFLSRKVNDNTEIQFSYTKRITRPSYNDLASYVGYSDPTAVYTGNPFLQPTITNNVKLGYNYKAYSFSLLFSRDDNAIARYQLTESPAHDILYISPQNLAWQNNITLQAVLPFKVNNWWSMSYSFAGGLRQYKATHTKNTFEKSYFGYSFNFSQTFKMPAGFSAEISGWYNNTTYNGSQQVAGFGILNAGVKKELKKNGGSFQLTVSDILMNERYRIRYGTVTQEAFSIKSYVEVNTESSMFPLIKLTYSRSFGNAVKTQKKNGSGSQEERSRAIN